MPRPLAVSMRLCESPTCKLSLTQRVCRTAQTETAGRLMWSYGDFAATPMWRCMTFSMPWISLAWRMTLTCISGHLPAGKEALLQSSSFLKGWLAKRKCGAQKDGRPMIECEDCRVWQHTTCLIGKATKWGFKFKDSSDPRELPAGKAVVFRKQRLHRGLGGELQVRCSEGRRSRNDRVRGLQGLAAHQVRPRQDSKEEAAGVLRLQ